MRIYTVHRSRNEKIKLLKFHSTDTRQTIPVHIVSLTCRHRVAIPYQPFLPEASLGLTRYLHGELVLGTRTSIFASKRSYKLSRFI